MVDSMDSMERDVRRAYNDLAGTYFNFRVTGKAVYNEYLEMPAMLAELGNVKGKKVLDVGCGPGIYAAALLKRGAIVYGIDQAEGMIKIAKEYAKGADFRIGSVYGMPYKSGFFDAVFASYVVHYFTDMGRAFREIRRVLKKNGMFVFSITNPFKEVTHHIPGRPYYMRKFYNYFQEGEQNSVWFGGTKRRTVIRFVHRTFETYIKTALESGFEIVDYVDAKPVREMKRADRRTYDYMMRVPQLSVFKLRKA